MINSINDYIVSNVKKTHSVLDVGCGDKRFSKNLDCSKVTTLDAWEKVKPDFIIDLEKRDFPFEENSFDVVLMIDFIEHIEKSRGFALLEQAKNITKEFIIIFTPLFWSDNQHNVSNPNLWCYGNKYDLHKSLWSENDFIGWERPLGCNERLNKYFIGLWRK